MAPHFDKMTELLTNMLGNVEKTNARVGKLDRKVQGSLPHVRKDKDKIKALGETVRELELFKDTLSEYDDTNSDIRNTEFKRSLLLHGFQPTMTPTLSAPPPT